MCRPVDRLLDQPGEVDYRAASWNTRFLFYGSDLVLSVSCSSAAPTLRSIFTLTCSTAFLLSAAPAEDFGMNLSVLHSHFLSLTHHCVLVFFFVFFLKGKHSEAHAQDVERRGFAAMTTSCLTFVFFKMYFVEGKKKPLLRLTWVHLINNNTDEFAVQSRKQPEMLRPRKWEADWH